MNIFSVNSFLWQEWGPFDYRGGKHYADPQWARCTTQLHYKDSQRTTQSSWSGDRYTFDSRLPRNCKKEGFRYVKIYTYCLDIQLMQEVWNQTQYKLWYIFVKFVHGLCFVLFYVLFVRKSNFHFSLWVHLFPHHMWNVNKFSQYKSVHRMFDNHWNEKSNRKHFIQKDPISMCISFFVCKSCDIIKKKIFFLNANKFWNYMQVD